MSSTEVILYDNNYLRTFADIAVKHLPIERYPGFRVFIPEDRTIYEYDGIFWNIKCINKTCMRNIEVILLREAERAFF